jgi:putative heme-binding domain-containing protein
MRRWTEISFASVLALATAFGPQPVWAQRELTNIPDADPAVELATLEVAEGFEISLFAADPELKKPIHMNFDAAGRLWVATSELYPHVLPGQAAHDKVIVLEDSDGDGRAEAARVFADDLLMPTGLEPGDGGVYVANSTELLHLADTDGDGRADRRRVILSGFGTEDTHHILHTLRWGPDGHLYMNQSIYIHSHIETPWGVRRLGGGGIWRLRPESLELEILMRGLVNPWGHHFDRFGQSFATDGAGGEGINYVVPGAYYFTAVGASKIMHGLNPGSPKHCGLEIVSGRHLPDDWQGNLITNDFRAQRVCRFVLSDAGAGYASKQMPEVVKSKNVAFRPVDVKQGPDGAIYIADWYNPIIQHGEVDFRDPRRDHTHGRIWRVTAKGRPLVERPKLVGATVAELLAALQAPEDWTRHHARLQLKARGVAVLPELAAWVEGLDPTNPNVEKHRLEALWVYQSLDTPDANLLGILLRARDPRVRAAATRVVQHWRDRLTLPLVLLATQVVDEHPRVRLEAVRVLAQLPDARAFELAMRAYSLERDRFLDYALWLTARDLADVWIPALEKGEIDLAGQASALVFALEAVDKPQVVRPLVALLESGALPADREETVLTLLGRLGGPDELAILFRWAIDEGRAPELRTKLLEVLIRAASERQLRPAGDLTAVGQLLASDDAGLRSAAIRAIGSWQIAALVPRLFEFASNAEATNGIRESAIEALSKVGGEECQAAIDRLATAEQPPAVRRRAIAGLANFDLTRAATHAVDLLVSPDGAKDAVAILSSFLEREAGAAALATALAGRELPADIAKLALRAVRSGGREQPMLIEAIAKAGGLGTGERVLSAEELSRLSAAVSQLGDPARGERIFRGAEQQCLKCHAIGGAGGQVGPDLSSIGASAQIDYLIESILLPNKAVKENYHTVVIATTDGRVHSGVPIRKSDRDIVIRTADDAEVAIPLDDIDEQAAGSSLMPVGLADTLTEGELLDLVRFLSELGKIGPYSVGRERVARRWQVLEDTPEVTAKLARDGAAAAADDDPALTWRPLYTQVDGTLSFEGLPQVFVPGIERRYYLAVDVDVSAGGPLEFHFGGAGDRKAFVGSEPKLWFDGQALDYSEKVSVTASPGVHRLLIVISARRLPKPVRLTMPEVEGTTAQAQFIGGK